jgi:hypothetical protein
MRASKFPAVLPMPAVASKNSRSWPLLRQHHLPRGRTNSLVFERRCTLSGKSLGHRFSPSAQMLGERMPFAEPWNIKFRDAR